MSQQINDNFQLLAALSLDDRYRQPTIANRDAISTSRRFQGLLSFVEQTQTLYILLGGVANLNWVGIAGPDVSNNIETVIEGFYVLSAGKATQLDWEVGDKFRGWIGNRYVVGTILALPVSLPSDIDNTSKVELVVDSEVISGLNTDQILNNSNVTGTTTTDVLNYLYVNEAFKRGVSIVNEDEFIFYLGDSQNLDREARVYINKPMNLPNNGNHQFGTYSIITQDPGGSGASAMASYDSRDEMVGTEQFNHLISFQGRNIYRGSGGLTYMSGTENTIFHYGNGNILNAYGERIRTPERSGSGTITNLYGLYIEDQSGASNNYAIRTGLGSVRFGDETAIVGKLYSYGGADFITPYAKTNASGYAYAMLGKTNEFTGYSALSLDMYGGDSQAVRQWGFQTIEQGVANNGSITFQGAGGRVLIGTTVDDTTNKLQVSGNITASAAVNSNQVVIKSQLDAVGRPYKVYTALLSQTGTSAPTATVLENTLGGTIIWTRTGIGTYVGTLSGVFTANKTAVFFTKTAMGGAQHTSSAYSPTTSTVIIINSSPGGDADIAGDNSAIEIRVYP